MFAASKAAQIKQQINKFTDYKDKVHLCLIGLDCSQELEEYSSNEETVGSASSSTFKKVQANTKLSIREFHEYVLQFLIADFVKKGFKYVSYLPGGFQQVHDMAKIYGFQLMNHQKKESDSSPF